MRTEMETETAAQMTAETRRPEIFLTALMLLTLQAFLWTPLFPLQQTASAQNAGEYPNLRAKIDRDIRYETLKLDAKNPMTRARAAEQLRLYAEEEANRPEIVRALDKLQAMLKDPAPVIRAKIAAVIIVAAADPAQRENAYQTLENDAKDAHYYTRLGVVETAELIGPDERLQSLLRYLAENDGDFEVAEAAEQALNALTRPRGNPNNARGFNFFIDFNPFGPPPEQPQAEPETGVGSPEQLALLQDAADRAPDPSALETLARLAAYSDGFQNADGERVPLAQAFLPANEPLLQFLSEKEAPNPLDLRCAAIALSAADAETLPRVAALLESPNDHAREAAAFALMFRAARQPNADRSFADEAGALAFALLDPLPAVRAYAAAGIGIMRAQSYAEDLQAALEDSDPNVQEAARRALETLQSEEEGEQQPAPKLKPLVDLLSNEEEGEETGEEAPSLAFLIAAGPGWTYFSNSSEEAPIQNARIRYRGPVSGEAQTDAEGRARVQNLPEGVYAVQIEAPGYIPVETQLSLQTGAAKIRLHKRY